MMYNLQKKCAYLLTYFCDILLLAHFNKLYLVTYEASAVFHDRLLSAANQIHQYMYSMLSAANQIHQYMYKLIQMYTQMQTSAFTLITLSQKDTQVHTETNLKQSSYLGFLHPIIILL